MVLVASTDNCDCRPATNLAERHDFYFRLLVLAIACSIVLVVLLPASPATARTVVTRLPGFDGPLPFHLETGYVDVEETTGTELFYYFVESERSPATDPVVLWLTGPPLPRCSTFSGLAFEVGPLNFVLQPYDGTLPWLVYSPDSWTRSIAKIYCNQYVPLNLDSPKPGRSLAEHYSRLIVPPEEPSSRCFEYRYYLSYFWANDNATRAALGIREGTVMEWVRCKRSGFPYTYDVPSSIKYHFNLTTRGYRALVYRVDAMLLQGIGPENALLWLKGGWTINPSDVPTQAAPLELVGFIL
nr:unnamed protein product [Digitaria exilis]